MDKFGAKRELLTLVEDPNLASPQLHVYLEEKFEQHIKKFQYVKEVKNDLYLEAINIFIKHLPENPIFLELHIRVREELKDGMQNGDEYFTKMVKDAQVKFKAMQEIQKMETASKRCPSNVQEQQVLNTFLNINHERAKTFVSTGTAKRDARTPN